MQFILYDGGSAAIVRIINYEEDEHLEVLLEHLIDKQVNTKNSNFAIFGFSWKTDF